MMCPPSILRVRIHNQRWHFGLWLPLFLVWPFVLVFGLVLWPILLVSTAVFWGKGWGKLVLLGGPALLGLLCAMRGLNVEVKQPSEETLILVSFR